MPSPPASSQPWRWYCWFHSVPLLTVDPEPCPACMGTWGCERCSGPQVLSWLFQLPHGPCFLDSCSSPFPHQTGTLFRWEADSQSPVCSVPLCLACDPSVTLGAMQDLSWNLQKEWWGLARADMIIIRIHLLKNFIYFIIPNTTFQDIFYAKPDKWIAFPRFFFPLNYLHSISVSKTF